jgi:hypothetical protein
MWEIANVGNQAKVKLYDQLIEIGHVELGETLGKADAKFKEVALGTNQKLCQCFGCGILMNNTK